MRFASILFYNSNLIFNVFIIIAYVCLNTFFFIQNVKFEFRIIFQQFEYRSFASFDFRFFLYQIDRFRSNVYFNIVMFFQN